MTERFLELEKGGWLNLRHVITIEPAAKMGFTAKYQIGGSIDTARVEPESVEAALKDAVFGSIEE